MIWEFKNDALPEYAMLKIFYSGLLEGLEIKFLRIKAAQVRHIHAECPNMEKLLIGPCLKK